MISYIIYKKGEAKKYFDARSDIGAVQEFAYRLKRLDWKERKDFTLCSECDRIICGRIIEGKYKDLNYLECNKVLKELIGRK